MSECCDTEYLKERINYLDGYVDALCDRINKDSIKIDDLEKYKLEYERKVEILGKENVRLKIERDKLLDIVKALNEFLENDKLNRLNKIIKEIEERHKQGC